MPPQPRKLSSSETDGNDGSATIEALTAGLGTYAPAPSTLVGTPRGIEAIMRAKKRRRIETLRETGIMPLNRNIIPETTRRQGDVRSTVRCPASVFSGGFNPGILEDALAAGASMLDKTA